FKLWSFREGGQRIRQVVVFLERLPQNSTKKRGQLIEIEIKQRPKNLPWWMTDLQANNTTTRSYHTQHLTKSLPNIGQIAYRKSRATTINTVIRQINMLRIPYT